MIDWSWRKILFFLLLVLQAGFAFYESGSVRSKNVTNALFLNYMDTSNIQYDIFWLSCCCYSSNSIYCRLLWAGIGSLFYLLCGYALAFGEGNGFCGTQYFALVGLPYDRMAHCFFQYTFSATAVSIIKSSLHERCSMTAYFTSAILLSGLHRFQILILM